MFRIPTAVVLALVLVACKPSVETQDKVSNVIDNSTALDPNSYAQTDKVRVEHLNLDLRVDMAARRLQGTAELQLHWLDPKAGELVLDTRDLDIRRIDGFDGKV